MSKPFWRDPNWVMAITSIVSLVLSSSSLIYAHDAVEKADRAIKFAEMSEKEANLTALSEIQQDCERKLLLNVPNKGDMNEKQVIETLKTLRYCDRRVMIASPSFYFKHVFDETELKLDTLSAEIIRAESGEGVRMDLLLDSVDFYLHIMPDSIFQERKAYTDIIYGSE